MNDYIERRAVEFYRVPGQNKYLDATGLLISTKRQEPDFVQDVSLIFPPVYLWAGSFA